MATRLKIYLEEENIKKLIKKIFREEFKKQEVNIINIISTNFTLTLKELKSLEQEVNDLKESLELTQNDLEKIVSVVEKKIFTFEIKIMKCMTTKSTFTMSMIVWQNCNLRYRR